MNIIRLASQHRNQLNFSNPMLDGAVKVGEEVLSEMIKLFVTSRDSKVRDDLILANLTLVKWVVGRYLYHWPETRNFEDDMVGEGVLTVCKVIDSLQKPLSGSSLQATLVTRIKLEIEVYLNNNRSMIRASLRTNYNRAKEGRELEYTYATTLDEKIVHGELDENPLYVDIRDALEEIEEVDKETIIDRVLAALEKHPQILESELSLGQREFIERITGIVQGND